MRLFCSCDCKKVREDLETAFSDGRKLKADLADLWERFLRLQGRLAKRGELKADTNGTGSGDAPDRDAQLNAEILARRGHNVSHRGPAPD